MKKPQCSKCHRPLTDPFSIAVGMGPECRGGLSKKGWKFPKPRYTVHHGRVELVGMTGTIERPNANANAKDEKRELVLRIKRSGGLAREAATALCDYMREKDSPVPMRWCQAFVSRIWKEEG